MIIFHIDVNNAFLSWESVYRLREEGETLDLRTVAAVIGGSEKTRHGIVLAKSPIAKTYGIKTAETLSDARKKCPNLLVVLRSKLPILFVQKWKNVLVSP